MFENDNPPNPVTSVDDESDDNSSDNSSCLQDSLDFSSSDVEEEILTIVSQAHLLVRLSFYRLRPDQESLSCPCVCFGFRVHPARPGALEHVFKFHYIADHEPPDEDLFYPSCPTTATALTGISVCV